MDQIRHEKKSAKKVRNTLSNFDTRIVSQIRASPASFAKIITNEGFYHDFRFDHHPSSKVEINKVEQEKINKK